MEGLPLQQRSLVASHPLLPDTAPLDFLSGPAEMTAGNSAPRCRSAHPNVFALAVESLMRGLHLAEPAMVEGAWPHCRGASHPQTRWRHASLGQTVRDGARPSASTGLAADSPIHWRASAECLASPLRTVLNLLAGEFGPLTVNSTCRSPGHNRRVGGATRSRHLSGDAVDFRVRGDYREVHSFLKRLRSVGGLAHYGSGVFHIDTGPRRTWAPGSWHRAGARRGRRA
jgi:Peptidase M15